MIEQTITKSSVVEIISIKISSLIDKYYLVLSANELSNHCWRSCTFPITYGVFHANQNSIHRETSWNNTGLPGKRETSERSVLFTSSLRLLFYQRLLSLELAMHCFTWLKNSLAKEKKILVESQVRVQRIFTTLNV